MQRKEFNKMQKPIIKSLFVLFLFLQFSVLFSQNDSINIYPLKKIIHFCQSDLKEAVFNERYTYDDKNRLINIQLYQKDSFLFFIKQIKYDSLGKPLQSLFHNGDIREYKYTNDLLLISDECKNDKISGINYKYSYNDKKQLVSELCYGIDWSVKCDYLYDSVGRLSKKYKNNSLEIIYEYSDLNLVKETILNKEQKTIITYEYNNLGLLLYKKINNQIIQKNIYKNDKLTEKWVYPIKPNSDPCILAPCCGEDVFRYEYN